MSEEGSQQGGGHEIMGVFLVFFVLVYCVF